jgi:hypothetical protein
MEGYVKVVDFGRGHRRFTMVSGAGKLLVKTELTD